MALLPEGVHGLQHVDYNGKDYQVPLFDTDSPVILQPADCTTDALPDAKHPIMQSLNQPFNLEQFYTPRQPLSLGKIATQDLPEFTRPGVQRVLDMPIKFPGSEQYRLPRALEQFATVIGRIATFEHVINPQADDYFAYLTVDKGFVQQNNLQREAPCHVDGFQGARWNPKVAGNHTYTVSDTLPTAYYIQPFDFAGLDPAVHNFFWEMNAQVADTRSAYKWQPQEAEITLMDCYSVHRGVKAPNTTRRTWLRLSFEHKSRIFDRLGNAHNPLFDYDWPMVERDIEQLGLIAFRQNVDPSLNVFPWQDIHGNPLPNGDAKTQPRLT
jgi:hypothetical protein